jgi:hypothetical protein
MSDRDGEIEAQAEIYVNDLCATIAEGDIYEEYQTCFKEGAKWAFAQIQPYESYRKETDDIITKLYEQLADSYEQTRLCLLEQTKCEEQLAAQQKLVGELNEKLIKFHVDSNINLSQKPINNCDESMRSTLGTMENMYFKEFDENARFRVALNQIGILSMGEDAYTAEFTEKVQAIVRTALGLKG